MVFVYSPALLIVLDDYFTLAEFIQTATTCALGVFMLSASVAGYFLVFMNGPSRVMFALAGLLLVSPSTTAMLYALLLASPVLAHQIYERYLNKGRPTLEH